MRWSLTSLKNQQYGGRDEKDGVKKPLNAFLGEVFLASGDEKGGRTRLVSEQISHHPPMTAYYLWNDEAGVRAEGYTCQEISFSGSVNIRQIGHAIDKYDKDCRMSKLWEYCVRRHTLNYTELIIPFHPLDLSPRLTSQGRDFCLGRRIAPT